MGLPIFRFYIKCTRCLAEITFKVSVNDLIIEVARGITYIGRKIPVDNAISYDDVID